MHRVLCAVPAASFPLKTIPKPAAPQIVEYLRAFADEFDLRRHIRFRTKVLCAELTTEADAPVANGARDDGKTASRLHGVKAQCWHVTSSPSDAGGDPDVVRCSGTLFSAVSPCCVSVRQRSFVSWVLD